jgi:hypothetical protein
MFQSFLRFHRINVHTFLTVLKKCVSQCHQLLKYILESLINQPLYNVRLIYEFDVYWLRECVEVHELLRNHPEI